MLPWEEKREEPAGSEHLGSATGGSPGSSAPRLPRPYGPRYELDRYSSYTRQRSFATKPTKLVLGDWFKAGGTLYDIYRGTFGEESVIVKRANLSYGQGDRLVKNDVAKTMMLQKGGGIARILICELNDRIALVAAEEYATCLSEFVVMARRSNAFDRYRPEEIIEQIVNVLQALRRLNVIHGDLRLSNMFVHDSNVYSEYFRARMNSKIIIKNFIIILETDWELKLEGFKHAVFASELENGALSEDLGKELQQLACIICSFHQKKDLTLGTKLDLHSSRTWSPTNKFRKYMAQHLAKMIDLNVTLSYADILRHPYFWTIEQMVGFEDRIRASCCTYMECDKLWDSKQSVVFEEEQWTRRIDPIVAKACVEKSIKLRHPPSPSTFTGPAMSRKIRLRFARRWVHF